MIKGFDVTIFKFSFKNTVAL